MPAFLANDILRMWRTFCVNYEARTSKEPPRQKAKRKLKNYKLKHSRLLTCYSAILYLLAVYTKQETVSPSHAFAMTKLTPTARLEWVLDQSSLSKSHSKIRKLLKCYEAFWRRRMPLRACSSHEFSKRTRAKTIFRPRTNLGT